MDVVSIGETMVLFTPEENGPLRYSHRFSKKIAGAETNTLIGLSKLGHHAGWISKIGDDEFGHSILSFVRGEGVDVSQVTRVENAPTGIFFKEIINPSHVNVHYYRKHSAASFLSPDDIDEAYLSQAKYLYITGITPALSHSCRQTIFHAIRIAKKHGRKVVFDPNLRLKLWSEKEARETLLALAKEVDIILPGITEGQFLLQTSNCEEIAANFQRLGAQTVVVKLGEEGAYFLSGDQQGYVAAHQVTEMIDPVGAGDGFAAGLLSGLLDDLSLEEAVRRACHVGAMVTQVSGDVEGLPDRKSLQKYNSTHSIKDTVER